MMGNTMIKPYKELERRIYGYILPGVPSHEGYVKVGETTRDTWVRVSEQVSTVGLIPKLLFERPALRADGKWFRDRDLHRFYELNGIRKARLGSATEWFFFNGVLEKAVELADKYINLDYDEIQIDDSQSDYILRAEQQKAVEVTLDYYNSGKEPREFLWNAKPRFGKTLTAYDFVRRIKAKNVLIVTNRPAIANSWFEDFQKFIAWQEPAMKFISETDALKGKALTREEFYEFLDTTEHENPAQITFLSLQDLKGAKVFGGEHHKLEWVAGLDWDLLIIDEAHEGVDTQRTDAAFDKINRKFTLHLSGTPFKALASNKFSEEQIFNWSYLDEQQAKENWDYIQGGTNPYEDLPRLNLFTYQMSKMIEEEVSQGLELEGGGNVDYAFDLNEFFSADDQGKFKYEESVRKFLDNLCSGHYPFSEGKHRDELQHTFWLLPRVNSAKAMEKLLKEHTFFKDYKVVLAAGDGISIDHDMEQEASDFKKNEKSYNKVKAAIEAAGENGKTITLSVGQLTTGVTIPEWSAVLMLSNIKSPSLYFQAAFRAQNPYITEKDGKLYRKENAYVFDFAPDRTLELYDQFANNLSGIRETTSDMRKEGIKELLNFFPVIGEDEDGTMKELDASEVLLVPTRIKSREVVKRGFMSNLLFANISGIFSGHLPFKEILDKIRPEKNKRLLPHREVNVTKPMLDDEGNVSIPKDVVINTTEGLFGPAIYRTIEEIDISNSSPQEITREITKNYEAGFKEFKKEYKLTNSQLNRVKEEIRSDVEEIVGKAVETYKEEVEAVTETLTKEIEKAKAKGDQADAAKLEAELEAKTEQIVKDLAESINTEVKSTIESAVEKQMVKKEEEKKKTTEDDVRDHLRGFARTIPAFLMAYGDENTTIDNFEENIDEATFEELTGITKDEFRQLRDGFEYVGDDGNTKTVPGLFNKVVFNASVKEFFATKKRLSNYFDESLTEDIFDYIPPQKTNQIFTPKRVVKMMVDMLEEAYPNLFTNPNIKFLDPYAKSGLYIAEITKRLYKGLQDQIPDSEERIRWILENQVYAIAPSNIIYNIVKNFVYPENIDVSTKNLVELDLAAALDEEDWQQRITQAFGGEELKFDVIIGNPPYQEMDGGAQASAKPLYHRFIQTAQDLKPALMSFIIPARWYGGGKGLDEFREQMLNDKHIREFHDWLTPDDIFPNTNIRSGVCYFLWDKEYDNTESLTRVVTHKDNKIVDDVVRPLAIDGVDIFIRDSKAISILEKVFTDSSTQQLSSVVSPRRPFGFQGYFVDDERFRASKDGLSTPIVCYGRGQVTGYVEREEVTVRPEWIDKWKVFTPRANNIGTELPDDNLNSFVGRPGTICTESYLVIGADLDLDETSASNLSKYLTTKFARYLHGLAKSSHDATARTYRFVPIQDFSSNSDIDWSVSVSEIDQQLFEKYGLSEEERQHIESSIKEM